MSYPAPPTAPRARPGVVKVAVNLLYLAAAIEIISAVLALLTYGPTKRGYEKAFEGTSAASSVGAAAATVIVGAIVSLVIGIILVVLATLDARGNNVARIITWVVGGLTICCVGVFSTLRLATNGMTGGGSTNGGPSAKEVQDAVNAELPSWLTPTSTVLSIIFVLALLAAVILLALPAANAFFSKRAAEPQWEPPVPPPGAPGGYGTPPAGGYGTPPSGYEAPPSSDNPGQSGGPVPPA